MSNYKAIRYVMLASTLMSFSTLSYGITKLKINLDILPTKARRVLKVINNTIYPNPNKKPK